MPRSLARIAAVLAVALALPAQGAAGNDGERRATFVRVEDGKGAPLAGATVTFAGHLPHLVGATGPTDVLRVQTDARGRAQGKLLPGLCYVAWAVGVPDADGVAACAAPTAWFAAGGMQTLRARGTAKAQTVRLAGLEAWRHVGPLRVALVTRMPGVDDEIAPDADGALQVRPGLSCQLEVRTADGAPLWSIDLAEAAGSEGTLTLPPPRRLRVLAKDEQGAPIAGAAVRLRVWRRSAWTLDGVGSVVEDRWRTCGVTDAEGALVVEAPYAGDPLQDHKQGDLLLFVGAPGRPSVAGGVVNGELYVDDRKAAAMQGDTLPFTLRAAPTLAGSLGKASAGAEVHLAAVCKLYLDRGSYRHDARGYRAVVAADGTFAFDDVPAEVHALRLCVVPAPGRSPAAMFPMLRARELPPEVAPDPNEPGKAPALADIALRVVDVRGGPARGLVAGLVPATRQGVFVRDSMVRVPLDSRGGADLRVAPGKWVVVVVSSDGFCGEQFDWSAGAAEAVMTMRELPRMRLQLRGADGAPVAGADVAMRGTSTRGLDDPLQAVLQQFRQRAYQQWSDLRTDADGRIELPFVPVEGVTVKFGLSWDGGRSEDLVLEATDDWVVVQPK